MSLVSRATRHVPSLRSLSSEDARSLTGSTPYTVKTWPQQTHSSKHGVPDAVTELDALRELVRAGGDDNADFESRVFVWRVKPDGASEIDRCTVWRMYFAQTWGLHGVRPIVALRLCGGLLLLTA